MDVEGISNIRIYEGVIMSWITSKNYKRKKTSVYMKQDIYEQVTRAALANELSFSAQLNILLERGMSK